MHRPIADGPALLWLPHASASRGRDLLHHSRWRAVSSRQHGQRGDDGPRRRADDERRDGYRAQRVQPGQVVSLFSSPLGSLVGHRRHGSSLTASRKQVHFLQVWAFPNIRGLTPRYATRHFTDDQKIDKLVTIVGPVGTEGVFEQQSEAREGKGPTPVRYIALSLHFYHAKGDER